MNRQDLLEDITQALKAFGSGSLEQNAIALFETLDYHSSRRIGGLKLSADNLAETFNSPKSLRPEKALAADWQSVSLLFQLTDDEISSAGRERQLRMVFDSASKVDPTIFRSYLFFTVGLKGSSYTRGQLAGITREINRLFPIPVMVLFRYGQTLTFAIIHRRPHRRQAEQDVLEKVTLIKDIRLANPHRAHLEILADLALPELYERHRFTNFLELHQVWQDTLNISELNKRFYTELANWYFWAVETVRFPIGAGTDEKARNAINVIRLITRLIFVWFIREKGLVKEDLFDPSKLEGIVRFGKPDETIYYKAVLQNLFFATLNTEMNKDIPNTSGRIFAEDAKIVGDYLISNKYRYRDLFKDSAAFQALCEDIPFLNGGLFECLDREVNPDELKSDPNLQKRVVREGSYTVLRVDGFSRRKENPLHVPDFLFFAEEQALDLNETYGTKGKRYKVRGLIPLLNHYKFTVEENTPLEEEVALDPELLGKVFENLLAAYNPETGATARKQTGSFYTPREIVNYMVDEALLAYLENAIIALTPSPSPTGERGETTDRLRRLLTYEETPLDFSEDEVQRLISAIERLKSLDPACGSGAFPMGLLHKLVYLLQRLDPDNRRWRELQRQKAIRETGAAYQIGGQEERHARLLDIEDAFTHNTSDYGRKLYLIENCIYGVDIQPIAVQIAKLRFFISLVVEQKLDDAKPNRGIRPLPNLETKFVAANTLIGINKPAQQMFRDKDVERVEKELADVRHKIFAAGKSYLKRQYRQDDERWRKQLAELLNREGWGDKAATQLAGWNPYDQNASAGFFEPEWMFGIKSGFDIVIGNPPWGATLTALEKETLKHCYTEINSSTPNSFAYFIGWAFKNAINNLSFVLPDSILIKDFEKTRALIKHFVSEIVWYENAGLPDEFKPFVYVDHDVCVINIQKKVSENLSYTLMRYDRTNKQISANAFLRNKKQFILDDFNNAFNLIAQEKDLKILEKIRQHKKLDSFMQCHEGIHTGNSREILFLREKKNQRTYPLFYGAGAGDQIENYFSLTSGWYVDYREEIVDKKLGYYASLRDERIFKFPKIYITRTGNPFKAFLDDSNYASNNFFSLQYKNYHENNIHDLMIILPFVISRVAQYFIRTFAAPRLGSTFVETKIFHLLKFSIPTMDASTKFNFAKLGIENYRRKAC